MPVSQVLLIAIVLVPLALVFTNRLRMDLAALIIAVALGTAQLLGLEMLGPAGSPQDAIEAISGFGQPVVITLLSLFILTSGLEQSGATRWLARQMLRFGGRSESRLIALFAGTTAFLSLFMNNLAAGALVLSSAIEVSHRTGIRPSKLLIPVAYGSLLGGSATYFTTANIIVSDLLRISLPFQQPLRIFDFTPLGGLIAIAGISFLAIWGKRLLPDRASEMERWITRPTGSELEDFYELKERLWEGKVLSESEIAGKTLMQTAIGENLGVEVVAIWRGDRAIFPVSPEQLILAEDILLMVGREEKVSQLQQRGVSVERGSRDEYISPLGAAILEILLAPRSKAQGLTLKELDFRRRFGFTAVALRRLNRSYRTDVGTFPLAMGDSILVIGPRSRIVELQRSPDYIVLKPSLSDQPLDIRPAIITAGIVLVAILAAILGFPIYLATLLGAVLIVLMGILKMEEAYHAIEWQAIFLVAGMYAVSLAMVQTGLAARLGESMVALAAPFGSLGLGAGAYLITALLTQLMGGQVTALVTGPIAISAAIQMGANPQAVAIATAIGCSASFFTPIAHPVNILMIGPGNYTFGDFFRIGWRLTLVCFVCLLLGLVIFWGLRL